MKINKTGKKIKFKAKIVEINSWQIIVLPREVSAKLPSRGMVQIKGTIEGFGFNAALEPDGEGSHWFRIDENILKKSKSKVGDIVEIEIEIINDWFEPIVPSDLKKAISSSSEAEASWYDITPMARWDWIRWINSTKEENTRKKRIDVTLSKFRSGKRRPCCFNRSMCTETRVSHRGILLKK